jgi:hypothetical protein
MDPLDHLFAEHSDFGDGANGIGVRIRFRKTTEPRELWPFRPKVFEVL